MKKTWEAQKEKLKKSNMIWKKAGQERSEMEALQKECAVLIQEVCRAVHQAIMDRYGVQGNLELLMDGDVITGIKANGQAMVGPFEHIFLLEDTNESSKREAVVSAKSKKREIDAPSG